MKHIVIIGGGFCGSVTAVNLARLTDAPLKVSVLNTRYPLARGIAYSTGRSEHLLNVVARNMSALADQPDHFLDWLGTAQRHLDSVGPSCAKHSSRGAFMATICKACFSGTAERWPTAKRCALSMSRPKRSMSCPRMAGPRSSPRTV